MSSDRSAYHREYKRRRYATDPAFRERLLSKQRERWAANRPASVIKREDERVQRRVRARAMLDGGASYSEVARTLSVDRRTVAKWYPNEGWSTAQSNEYRALRRWEKRLEQDGA